MSACSLTAPLDRARRGLRWMRHWTTCAYYDRKREQGKRHNQALLALAHRRILTLHAMIRTGTLYDPQPTPKLAQAA